MIGDIFFLACCGAALLIAIGYGIYALKWGTIYGSESYSVRNEKHYYNVYGSNKK
jgi:hypothetical protein